MKNHHLTITDIQKCVGVDGELYYTISDVSAIKFGEIDD